MSLALARKYRPRSFADLVGQETVSQTLAQALDTDRLSHAYLFSGLRGSGKTSTARIFAKALLCEKGPTSTPCEECPHCTMANENRHMDIIEMDAASNRGIDDIKELIEHTKYKPGSGRYKIFIIDEVHMLTTQAFNALLKTLEEPPDFVKFILATTDPLKLPATILSRTQHFRFKKIPPRLVLAHLEHILNLEGIDYEPEALEIIARSGAGSLRDSLTLLDQAIVYAGERIDLPTVTGMLGIIEPGKLDALLDRIAAKDVEGVMAFIRESAEFETEMIIDELTLHLKGLLLSHDPRFTPIVLDRFFRILAEAKELLFIGSDGEFVLGLTLMKMIEALKIKEIDEMIHTLQKELSGIPAPTAERAVPSPTAAPKSAAPEPVESQPAAPATEAPRTPTPPSAETEKPSRTPPAQSAPTGGTSDRGALAFEKLKEKLYDRDYDLGSCFERCIHYRSFDGSALTWESSAQGEDRKLLVRHWSLIRTFVQEIFGLETRIVNIPALRQEALTEGERDREGDKKKVPDEEGSGVTAEAEKAESPEAEQECALPENARTSGTVEAEELPSSCMNPDTGSSEASREIDPESLLEEPMIKEAIERFRPKKVRIRRKS
ncbi:DNA polymerase III subunit gamma/tau [Nitratifractor sp.]